MVVDLDENALAGALGRRSDHLGLGLDRDDGQFGRSSRVVEDLVTFVAVGDAVLEDAEDLGGVIGADAVAGTEVLIDPDQDPGGVTHDSPGYQHRPVRHGPGRYPVDVTSAYGSLFRITTFGESHGPAVGVVVDGCPPGVAIDGSVIQRDLDRRRPGQSRLVTQRQESDEVEILSGVHEGHTTGAPVAMLVRNADHRPGAYDHLREVFRPSHADYAYLAKYGRRDHRGGGRSSARETIGRVAAAALARRWLTDRHGVEVLAWVAQVHTIDASVDHEVVTLQQVEATPTRCPDPVAAAAIETAVDEARRRGDSLGGVVGFVARGVPPGWGEPVFDRLDADIGKGVLSLPACKAFEIGSGFAGTRMTGLDHNDPYEVGPDGTPTLGSNRSGGVQGGISVGASIYGRAAFKPTATIASEQRTVTTSGEPTTLAARGRHDPCVLPRAVPMVEAMVLLTLADHALRQQAYL